jgi:lipopolysaccharide transport system permease protein
MRTVISSTDRSILNLSELRRFSGLFRYLSLRDVFVRYKQTWIGFGWSIVRPLINIIIFGCLSYLVDRSGDFSKRFVVVSAGIVFWQLISTCITEVSNSLTANANLFTKVYFPRLILPFSSILVCLVDFVIAFLLFLFIYFFTYGFPPVQVIFVPLVIVYSLVFCLAAGLLFATASVKYRDVKFILPFLLQILFYASPVFLSSDFVLGLNIPQWMKVIYQLNPLVYMINAFKYCFFGSFGSFSVIYALASVIIALVLTVFSLNYFLRFERSFADYI